MPHLQTIEAQGACAKTTDRENNTDGRFESKAVASPPFDNGLAGQDRVRRKKPLAFYGSFMSIVIMILMVSLDSSELGVALTVNNLFIPSSLALQIRGYTYSRLDVNYHFRQSAHN